MVRKKKHKAPPSAGRGLNDPRPSTSFHPASESSPLDPQSPSSGANTGKAHPTSATEPHRKTTKHSSRSHNSHNTRQDSQSTSKLNNHPQNQPNHNHSQPHKHPHNHHHHHHHHHRRSSSASASAQPQPGESGENASPSPKPSGSTPSRHLQTDRPPGVSSNHQVRRYRGDRRRRSRGRSAGRQPWRDHSSDSSQSSPASSSSSNRQTVSEPETQPTTISTRASIGRDLPGFYFDPVKKKYFRILPGHQSTGSATVTRESLQQKATEEARQQSLREFALRTIQTDPTYGFSSSCTGSHLQRCVKSPNINHHVFSLKHGLLKPKHAILRQNRMTLHQLSRLQPSCQQKVLAASMGPGQGKIEHMTKMLIEHNSDSTSPTARLVCLWSLKSLLVQRIQLIEVNRVARVDDSAIMDSCPVGAVLTPSLSKVTDLCWAHIAPDDNTASPVLYTTTCVMGTNPSLAKLRHLDPGMASSERDQADTEFHLGNKTTWSCAWSAHTRKFSVGIQESALVIDVATRRLWEFHTKKSDVLTQTFSNTDGNMLYSGTRRGEIVVHDLRSNSTRWVSVLNHKSSLSHLHLMRSGSHLLASDFSGRLCTWDLRMRRVVQDFKGHNNEYTRIPFMVDSEERFICGAGQDCYSRVWDLRTAELVVSVPPPYPASRDLIPAVCLYTAPTGHMDRPGLLMGVKDELHLYTC